MITFHNLLLCATVGLGMAAVMTSKTSRAVFLAGLTGLALSLLFLEMGAQWAAVFQMAATACTAILLALTRRVAAEAENSIQNEDRAKYYLLPVLLAVFGLAFWLFSEPLSKALVPGIPPDATYSAGDIMWRFRWMDITAVTLMILAVITMLKSFFSARNR